MEINKLFNHEIVISPSHNNGIIVKIGCGTFCYSNRDLFLTNLKGYLDDSEKWEKEYNRSIIQVAEECAPDEPCPEPPIVSGTGRE